MTEGVNQAEEKTKEDKAQMDAEDKSKKDKKVQGVPKLRRDEQDFAEINSARIGPKGLGLELPL